jgi:acyl-CoA carboxylase subunit beta
VYEAVAGRPFPGCVQTAENLRAHGLVDAVLPPAELAAYLDGVLTAITPATGEDPVTPPPAALAPEKAHPCVLVAQDRTGPTADVAALRLARRGMLLAEDLRIPLVTMIDTPGAELSPQAEEQGLASEIAQCIALLINLRTATVAVLLGEGTCGGALALLPADRVLAAQHAWLAPLAPEGASAIVYKDRTPLTHLSSPRGSASGPPTSPATASWTASSRTRTPSAARCTTNSGSWRGRTMRRALPRACAATGALAAVAANRRQGAS